MLNPQPIYYDSIVTTKIVLHIREIGKNCKKNLENKLFHKISNKCIPEGYVKQKTVKIESYSAGLLSMSDYIEYKVVYKCKICHPVEGMLIKSVVKHVTKAGLHCRVVDEDGDTPIVIFIIREHNVLDEYFNSIKENDEILVKVIGVRFELNDPYISVIGNLVVQRNVGGSVGDGGTDNIEEGGYDEQKDEDNEEHDESDNEGDDEEYNE